MDIEVLTVSSKGQIVLPAKIRRSLGIESGSRLAVYSSGDVIMLKPIFIPTEKDFSTHLDETQSWAKAVGYKETDVADIINNVRKKKLQK